MSKKEGFTWFERQLRKYGGPSEVNLAFAWDRWSSEKRKNFFDEFPIKSPITTGRIIVEAREKISHKYWNELSAEEKKSLFEMYCVWHERHRNDLIKITNADVEYKKQIEAIFSLIDQCYECESIQVLKPSSEKIGDNKRKEKKEQKLKLQWVRAIDNMVKILSSYNYNIYEFVREMESISSISPLERKQSENALLLSYWVGKKIEKDNQIINRIKEYIEKVKEIEELEKIFDIS